MPTAIFGPAPLPRCFLAFIPISGGGSRLAGLAPATLHRPCRGNLPRGSLPARLRRVLHYSGTAITLPRGYSIAAAENAAHLRNSLMPRVLPLPATLH